MRIFFVALCDAVLFRRSNLATPTLHTPTGIKGGESGWSAREWRALISGIQEEARALGMPPVLYAIDHVHGTVMID